LYSSTRSTCSLSRAATWAAAVWIVRMPTLAPLATNALAHTVVTMMLTVKPSSAIVTVGPWVDVCAEVPVEVVGGSLVEWSSMVPNVAVPDGSPEVWEVCGAIVEPGSGDPGLDRVVAEVAGAVVLFPGDDENAADATAAASGWAVPSTSQPETVTAMEVPRASPITNVRQPVNDVLPVSCAGMPVHADGVTGRVSHSHRLGQTVRQGYRGGPFGRKGRRAVRSPRCSLRDVGYGHVGFAFVEPPLPGTPWLSTRRRVV